MSETRTEPGAESGEFLCKRGEKAAFLLFTKKEVREKQLFGPGKEGAAFDGMLGDYLAVAVSDLSIYSHKKEKDFFIGVHAGLLEDEMVIPLLLIGSREAMSSDEICE